MLHKLCIRGELGCLCLEASSEISYLIPLSMKEKRGKKKKGLSEVAKLLNRWTVLDSVFHLKAIILAMVFSHDNEVQINLCDDNTIK